MPVVINGTGSITGANTLTGVPVNGPAFSAYKTVDQTGVASGTYTKINYATEEYDTNANYDTSLSRFTPTVSGYYMISAWATAVKLDGSHLVIGVGKNGGLINLGAASRSSGGMYPTSTCSSLVFCNGTTDYIEVFAFPDAVGAAVTTLTGDARWRAGFLGFLARVA